MDNDKMFDKALASIEKLSVGEIFVVKDLFLAIEWNQYSSGEKQGFGKYFKNKVELGKVPDIQFCGKAANNSAQYKKTSKL